MKLGNFFQRSHKDEKEDKKIQKTQIVNPKVSSSLKTSVRAAKCLLCPVVSEKATLLGKYRQYVFQVDPRSNKIEIARAVNELYDIKPSKIQIIRPHTKHVRFGKYSGTRKAWKKAIVTLPEGKSLNLYEGV